MMTYQYIYSLGAPFALISELRCKNWFGATENEGVQYDKLLNILNSEIDDDAEYNIINCQIDDVELLAFDKNT